MRPCSVTTIYPPRNFVFDYFLKDHIGNVLAIISEEVIKSTFDNPLSFNDPSGLSEECTEWGNVKERDADPDETLEKEEVHSDIQVEIQAEIENRKVNDANNENNDGEENVEKQKEEYANSETNDNFEREKRMKMISKLE